MARAGFAMLNSKDAARQLLRQRRADAIASAPAARLIPPRPEWMALLDQISTVAAYHPLADEADPAALVETARQAGKTIALPRLTKGVRAMRFHQWTDAPLEQGPFGILQPCADAPAVNPECILMPLVGFTRAGHRLGQGGGYYDRALVDFPEAWRIGVALSVQEGENASGQPYWGLEAWDMPMHAVLTEKEWIQA